MKLFLAAKAKHPESIEKLRNFIGGFEGKSIVCIPTAENGENPYGEWETNSETWKLVNTLGANATSVVLEEHKNTSVIDQFNEDAMLPEIKEHWNGKKIYLLEYGEVITVVDGKIMI